MLTQAEHESAHWNREGGTRFKARPKGIDSELMFMGPLDGVRIVDAASILAGPLCAQILGDFGADVVKVELPGNGDAMRGHGPSKDGVGLWWSEVGRNKRTVGLDLRSKEGAAIFRRLVAPADVLVESFRPGTLERWGLDPADLVKQNPRLIVLRISGFGQVGPYAHRAGFGTLVEAMSGFAHLTGDPDGPPTLPAFGLADTICGIAGSSAVSMALLHRERTGQGQIIDLSLLEPMLTAVGPGPAVYQQLGVVGERTGNRSQNNAPRNIYRTKDNDWVAVSTSAQAVAERVLRLVGRPDVVANSWFATGRGRVQHADELDNYVAEWIAVRTRAEVVSAFTAVGAAVAPVYTALDVVEDEHVRAIRALIRVPDPVLGDVLQHNVLWRMSASPGEIRHAGRPIGADTDEILGDLGLTKAELDECRRTGVIA